MFQIDTQLEKLFSNETSYFHIDHSTHHRHKGVLHELQPNNASTMELSCTVTTAIGIPIPWLLLVVRFHTIKQN